MEVKIKRLDKKAIIPFYGTEGAAGMDIVPISMEYKEDIDCYVYHTGLAFEIPKGYAMFIFPRSSNRKTNAYLANMIGILDSDYRGELQICYKNRTGHVEIDVIGSGLTYASVYVSKEFINLNKPPYEINGEAIAQIVIMPYPKIEFKEVEELSETERGENGFGSTNLKVGSIIIDKSKFAYQIIAIENNNVCLMSTNSKYTFIIDKQEVIKNYKLIK